MIPIDSNWQRLPVRGQEFSDGVGGGGWNAAENVTQIRHWIVTVTPGTHDEGVTGPPFTECAQECVASLLCAVQKAATRKCS